MTTLDAIVTRGRPPLTSPPDAPDPSPAPSLDRIASRVAEIVGRAYAQGRAAATGVTALAPGKAGSALVPTTFVSGSALADVLPPELVEAITRAAGDPLVLLTLLDSAFQSSRLEGNVATVESARSTAEQAALERERAIERAIERASRSGRLPAWLKKVVKAIALAASVAASSFTGGTLAAVALAGTALMLAAPEIGRLAVELGMDPEKARRLVAVLQAVGGAMSLAAGGGGASTLGAPSQLVERVAELTSRVVGATGQVLEGSEHVAQSAFRFRAARAQNQADLAEVRVEAERAEVEDALATLRDGMRSLERALGIDAELLRLRAEATQAVLRRAI